MKRILIAVALVMLLVAVAVQAQAPKPAPEIKKMEFWVGDWTYAGEAKQSPLGPAAKISGKLTARWILNGFFLEWKTVEKGIFGDIETIEFDWYDAATNTYPYQGFQNNGDMYSGSATMSGNTVNISETHSVKGVQYKLRGVNTIAPDGTSVMFKLDLSPDGKNWAPLAEIKYTKAKPAPKK